MHRKQHRRLRKKFVTSRDPLGDTAHCKWDFIQNGQVSIGPTTTTTPAYLDFSNLEAVISAFNPDNTNAECILPPGLYTWLNGYKNYRVLGCSINFEVINEGYISPTVSTTNMTQPYTPYAAVSFEGPYNSSSGPSPEIIPISGNAYWTPASIQQQRWARWKIMAAPGASRQITKVKQYCSTFHLSPDKIPNNLSTYGYVAPSTSGVPPAPPGAAPSVQALAIPSSAQYGRYVGWAVGNWNGVPNSSGITTHFTYRLRLRLYVKLFNKISNASVW